MRCSLFIICLLALTTATGPTTFAAYSITNSGFDAQDGSVHLNSTLSATGWFNANNGPNTQSDTLINSQNGAQGGWDGNGFLLGNDAPFSVDGTSEQAYIYQSIGTYAGEGSITVTGYVFNRILNPILRGVGNFDAALYYTSAGAFTPAVGNDIALSGAVIGSPKVFANGVDFNITTNTTSQKAFWSHTATFAGSGISNGNEVWLRIGDGGNPTGLDWDEPVIDNLNVAPFVLGDANGDGAATLTDFTAIKNNFRLAGTSRAQGDVDTSGDVDFLDYLQWRAAFLGGGGVAADIPALFSVPEPAFGTLLALALIGICPRLRANARGQRRSSNQFIVGVVSLLAILVGSPTNVQAIDNPWNVVSGNWNTPENWLNGQVPNRAADDFPVISNGGTATLNSAAANPVGGVIIGQNAGETGVVEILPGGSLVSTNTGVGTGDGIVRVGTGGTGTLRMTGGTLNTTRGIDVGQNAVNLLELSGNAVITSSGNFSLGGTTRVAGPSVNVTALNYNLRTSSVYVAGINSSTQFSTLKTSTPSGVVTVQGSFQADYTGVTPPVGSTWSLFEGGAVVGNFTNAANVTVTGVPATVTGEAYRTRIVNGGAFGKKLELVHDSVLALQVNRDTGAVAILNPLNGGIPINSYSITSAAGSLKPANGSWSSLTDQGTANWQEANPTVNNLAELNATTGGNFNFASVPSKSLGNAYDDGAAFFSRGIGSAGNDLVFDYLTNSGELIRGQVVYTGAGKTNNLLVTINPNTGNATLRNDSPGSITIDGFSVLSTGAALVPGSFNGLGSPLLSTVSPTTSALSQLAVNPNSPLAISSGQSFNLGNIFNTASAPEGIALEFTTQGVNRIFNGVVRFQAGLPGDYDGNGSVNGTDFLVWQRALGSTVAPGTGADGDGNGSVGAGDLTVWRNGFGTPATVAAAAVPEPGTASCLLFALVGAAAAKRRMG